MEIELVTEAPREKEQLLTGRTGRLTITLSTGMLIGTLGRELLPPILPLLITELEMSPAKAGLALTVLWGVYGFSQFPGGRLSDDLSRKTILVGGLLVSGVGFLFLAAITSFGGFLVSGVLLGAGLGSYVIAMRGLLSDMYVERRGQAFGLNQAASQGGGAFAAGVAAVALALHSWRAAFLFIALLHLPILVAVTRWVREPLLFSRIDFDVRGTLGRIVETRKRRRLLVTYGLVIFAWRGAFSFLPTFLRTSKGFSSNFANLGFALLFITGIVVMPLAGRLSDRRGRVAVAGGGALLSVVGLSTVIFIPSVPLTLVGIVLFGTGLMSFPPGIQAYLMEIFPEKKMGGDFGAFRTVYIVIASLGPSYVGVVAQWHSYVAAFVGLVFCLALSFALLLTLEW